MADSYRSDSAVMVSRGASYLTIQTVVTSVAQVLSFAILARIISPSEVGILAVLSLITNLTQAINGGAFQQASMKYVGEYSGTHTELAAGVLYQTLQISLVISIPMAAFVFLGAELLGRSLLGAASQAGLFRVLAVDVLVFAGVLPVGLGAVLGLKSFKVAAAIGTAGALLRQFLIIVLILLLNNFVGLIYGWIFSDCALFAGYTIYAVHVLGPRKEFFPLAKLIRFSWPLSIGNVVNFAYGWFDRAVLIVFVSLASLGVYNASLYAFTALSGISFAFTNALLPVYSKIGSQGGLEGCRRATRVTSRYVSLVMVPLGFGLAATAKPALTVFVGEAYVGGAIPLMILSVAFALTAFSLATGPMLTALGLTRAVMWITIASVVLGLASAYLLLPILGIVGASAARDVATAVSCFLGVLVLYRMRAMSIDVEMVWKTLVASAVMAVVLVGVQMFAYSKILLPMYVLLGAFIYLGVLRMLKAVRNRDIELIQRYLGSRLGFAARLLGVILDA